MKSQSFAYRASLHNIRRELVDEGYALLYSSDTEKLLIAVRDLRSVGIVQFSLVKQVDNLDLIPDFQGELRELYDLNNRHYFKLVSLERDEQMDIRADLVDYINGIS